MEQAKVSNSIAESINSTGAEKLTQLDAMLDVIKKRADAESVGACPERRHCIEIARTLATKSYNNSVGMLNGSVEGASRLYEDAKITVEGTSSKYSKK